MANRRARMSYWKRLICIVPILLLVNASFAATKPAPKPTARPATATQAAPQQPAAQSAPAEVIRAKRIELTDDQGNVRALIGIGSDGEAIIKLLGKDGKTTLALKPTDGLGILGEDGKRKIVVGAAGAGYGIGVYDSKGKPRAEVTLVDDEPMMAMSDSNGKFRVEMFLIKDQPVLNLSDGTDNGASVRLKVKGSAPSVLLTDGSGTARTEYSLADDGAPRLLLANSTGSACMNLSISDDLPSIVVSNPKTKVAGTLGFTTAGDLGLMFLNADQKVRAAMALRTGDDPLVYVLHPSGNPAATMGISGGKGYFSTSDSDGGFAWQNP
jgi:hypothetical protein